MAAAWDQDSPAIKDQLQRAYGAGTASPVELAGRPPTIITFDDQELAMQRAKAHGLKERASRL